MSLFNGYKTEYYNNGDKYVGYFKDGKRHGEGTYYYVNGNRFDGDWVNGIKHGEGVMYYNDGTKFFGDWKDGLRHGVGVVEKPNGNNIIRCMYKNNKLFNIVINKSEKLMYVGQLLDDWYHGIGILTTPNETCIGEWNEGKSNGFGTLSLNGHVYNGHFVDDMFNGFGTIYYQDGVVYHGQFKDGKLNGFGYMKYNDGSFYVGFWKDNIKHGNGYHVTNDFAYHGDFVNDNYHGEGCYMYEPGKFYIGEFKNGYADGHGSFLVNDTPINTGIWSNWKFIESKEISLHDFIKNHTNRPFRPIKFNDNTFYVGEVVNNKINGYGIYFYDNGNFVIGKWEDEEIKDFNIVFNQEDNNQINVSYINNNNTNRMLVKRVNDNTEEINISTHDFNGNIVKRTIISKLNRIEIQTILDDNTINYKIYSEEKDQYLEFNTLDDVIHGKYLCFDCNEYTLIEEDYYRGSKE